MRPRELLPYVADEGWFRFNPRGMHGAPHTTRVVVWSDVIADRLGRPDALRREELRWAAAVHDVGRVDDGIDRGHGSRSAEWVRERLAAERPLAPGLDLDFVAELCQWHEVRDQDIPRLSLELLILKSLDSAPNHGFGITVHVQEASGGLLGIEEGSLYPALHRLEKDGALAAEWGTTAAGRRARFYRLTPAGRKRLARIEQQWATVAKGMARLLRFA